MDGGPADRTALERKEFLGAAAAALVALVAPRVALASTRGTPSSKPRDWNAIVDAAKPAISKAVDRWAASAAVEGAEVNGSAVFVAPGTVTSEFNFVNEVENALAEAGAGEDVAAALAGVAWEGWRGWVSGYALSLPAGIQAFAAVPGPEAPSTPLKPMRLREGDAHGRIGMTADAQREALVQLLGQRLDEPGALDAIDRYARWYEKSFADWFQHATVRNLVASGPVPSFAPPYVPVGPVVGGVVRGSQVLDAPPFGWTSAATR